MPFFSVTCAAFETEQEFCFQRLIDPEFSAGLLISNHSCCRVTLIAPAESLPPITLGCNPHQLMNCQGFQVQGKPQPDAPTFPAHNTVVTKGKEVEESEHFQGPEPGQT